MRISKFLFAVLSFVLGTAFYCNAQITYDVNLTIAAGGVTGDIVTDGTLGVLSTGDILNYNLLLNDGTNIFDLMGPSAPNDDYATVFGNGLSATPTQLLFDFSNSSVDTFAISAGGSAGKGVDIFFVCSIGECSSGPFEDVQIGTDATQTSILSGTQVIGDTPEPSTLVLLGAGVGLLGLLRYRPKKAYRKLRVKLNG
jgi:PEP-CTERM motif